MSLWRHYDKNPEEFYKDFAGKSKEIKGGKNMTVKKDWELKLEELVSDKKLIKQLTSYMVDVTSPEKDNIIRALKRSKIGDKVTAKAIIKRSRELPALVKVTYWVEPEDVK